MSQKFRIILIERQGITLRGTGDEVYPDWFLRLAKSCDEEIPLYKNSFLDIAELPENALRLIALDYRNEEGIGIMQKYKGNETLFEEEWGKISEILNRRGGLSAKVRTIRPLIVLFMVDSSIRHLDYYKWDIDEILRKIIERYETHWEKNLCSGDNDLFKAVQKLLMYSTACTPWLVGETIAGLEAESNLLNELGREKLSQMLPYVNEYDVYEEQMIAFEPDLLGEFFVLKILKNTSSPTRRRQLVKLFWNADADSFAFFLQMCVYDYSYSVYFKDMFENFKDLFLSEDNFATGVDTNEIIAGLLLEITYVGVPNRTQDAIESLAALMSKGKKDEYLALRYVTSIYNRLTEAGIEEGNERIKEIRLIAEQYEDNCAIFSTYCEAMNNLIITEHAKIDAEDSGKKLQTKLARITAHIDTLLPFVSDKRDAGEDFAATVAIFFVKCIQNPMLVLNRKICMEYLGKAGDFIERSQTLDAMEEYIIALMNFSARDEVRLEDILPYYNPLKKWIQTYEESSGKAFNAHMRILTNLTLKGESEDVWLAELKNLYEALPDEFSATYYAMALCNFTYSKTEAANADVSDFDYALEKLSDLLYTHGDISVAAWYCRAHINYLRYFVDDSLADCIKVADRLSGVMIAGFTNDNIVELGDIVISFAQEIMNLCDNEDFSIEVASELVRISEDLTTGFPETILFAECVAFVYMRIANLCSECDSIKAQEAVNRIRKIFELNFENEYIANYLVDALSSLSAFISEDELPQILSELVKLYDRFPAAETMAYSFVMTIRNFIAICDAAEIKPWFDKALLIYRKNSEDEEILENCFDIIYDFLTVTRNCAKAEGMLNALKKITNFKNIESDECKASYSDLIARFKEIQDLSDE